MIKKSLVCCVILASVWIQNTGLAFPAADTAGRGGGGDYDSDVAYRQAAREAREAEENRAAHRYDYNSRIAAKLALQASELISGSAPEKEMPELLSLSSKLRENHTELTPADVARAIIQVVKGEDALSASSIEKYLKK